MNFKIASKNLEIKISLAPINKLHLHEETIPTLVDEIASSILEKEVIKNPVIVDKGSFVVLDGMHRVEAAKKVGCIRMPVCLLDYFNPLIKVGVWYRTFNDESLIEVVRNEALKLNLNLIELSFKDAKEALLNKQSSTIFLTRNKCSSIKWLGSLKKAYEIVKLIEGTLIKFGGKVEYETEFDAENKLLKGFIEMVMAVPPVSKEDVINFSLKGLVFPHKVTRHVIPARPMEINVPLKWLKDESISLEEANKLLTDFLSKRKIERISPGSLFEGRRYEEEIFLFK
ncbi:ParB N-terminal domain-containing protein [Candidatus Bathyarchaeota archaeon]|nr:ParB N-terminal domain-containing protein [Candidatus Bathyarchaeota archaeon]